MATKFIGSTGLTKLINLVKSLVNTKQDIINVDGILEGDGSGNISAASSQEVTTVSIDNAPTPNSPNLVKSGGVWSALQNAGSGLPDQTDNSGKFLTTDGTDPSWATVDALPSQTGNNGKFLKTNGTSASWDNVPTPPSPANANPLMDGTVAIGTSTDYAREDHVHPTDTSRAPENHASTSSTYGTGTETNYGHVKLSDSTSSNSGTSGGVAATPAAVKAAYDLANGKQAAGDYKTKQTAVSDPVASGTSMSFIDSISQNVNGEISATKKSIDTENVAGVSVDNVPMDNSTNLVKSGGVKSALDAKQDTLTFDNTPTANSNNPVTSGGVKSALDAKQDTLTIDSAPTADSNNLVTSGGVHTALRSLDPFPSQTGNSGKFLTTDGTDIEWETVDIDAALNSKITYGTTDLTPGTSPLATGVIYLVYE